MQAKWGSTWQGTSWASLVSVSYLSGFLPLGTSLKWKGRASNQNLSKTFSLLIIVLWKSHLLKWPSFEDTEAVSKSHFRELVFRLTIKEFTLIKYLCPSIKKLHVTESLSLPSFPQSSCPSRAPVPAPDGWTATIHLHSSRNKTRAQTLWGSLSPGPLSRAPHWWWCKGQPSSASICWYIANFLVWLILGGKYWPMFIEGKAWLAVWGSASPVSTHLSCGVLLLHLCL